MVAVKLSDIMPGSIRVLEWLVILIDCKIKGINELDTSEFNNSLVELCLS